jgi:hypothetical protein
MKVSKAVTYCFEYHRTNSKKKIVSARMSSSYSGLTASSTTGNSVR